MNMDRDPTEIAKTEIVTLAERLHHDLSKELFEDESVEQIENTRKVCDLESICKQIRAKGSILVGTLLADSFVDSARKITKTIHEVPDKTLKENYKSFLKTLEDHLKAKEDKPNDSKELIRD